MVEEDVNRQSLFVANNSKLSTHNLELPSMQLTGSIEALQGLNEGMAGY